MLHRSGQFVWCVVWHVGCRCLIWSSLALWRHCGSGPRSINACNIYWRICPNKGRIPVSAILHTVWMCSVPSPHCSLGSYKPVPTHSLAWALAAHMRIYSSQHWVWIRPEPCHDVSLWCECTVTCSYLSAEIQIKQKKIRLQTPATDLRRAVSARLFPVSTLKCSCSVCPRDPPRRDGSLEYSQHTFQ